MNRSYVSAPALVLGEHVIEASRVREDILAAHPDHPQREAIRKALANLPGTRRYFQPYEKVVSPERTAAERKTTTFDDLLTRSERAARTVIAGAGLEPEDIDCIVVSSSTGDMVPGLDIHLQQRLGLRKDIRRRPMTQLACAGGAQALIVADEYLAKYPGANVLVVVGEELSSIHQESKTALEDMIYKALWGDCVAAVVVSGRPRGAALRIESTLEYTIPNTTDRYRKETDDRGDHFASTRASLRSVTDLAPDLKAWLHDHKADSLDFAVLHPGGPGILAKLGKELSLGEDVLRHSRDVLTYEGNLGGSTIFSVLDRTHRQDKPPVHGESGLVFGLGPGVSFAALTVTWFAPAS